jgi:hypothetical protein
MCWQLLLDAVLVLLLISTAAVADSPVLAVTQHLRLSFPHRISDIFCCTGFVCTDGFDGHQLSIVCACSKCSSTPHTPCGEQSVEFHFSYNRA